MTITKLKLTTAVLVLVTGLLAAPAAFEQLRGLKGLAERWSNDPFLNGVVAAHTDDGRAQSPAPLSLSLMATPAQNSAGDFRWSGRVATGRTIEIRGINGALHAEPSSGGEVEVTAVKSARRSDPAGVEIRVVEHAGGVTICAVYPSPDSSQPNQCAPGGSGNTNVRDNDVRVEFTVRVPQGVRFSGNTVNGDVETGALGADVDVKTVNGDIKTSSSGIVRAHTVNGSIDATMSGTNWSEPLEFKTVNGAITLSLPSGTNAEIRADTVNGEISTDFPITVLGSVSRRRLSGTIGAGGRELLLKTVNGSINLRRAG